jgi:hypothetical protein
MHHRPTGKQAHNPVCRSIIDHPPRTPPSQADTPTLWRMQPRRLNHDLGRLGYSHPPYRGSAISTASLRHIPLYSRDGAWRPWQMQAEEGCVWLAFWRWPFGMAWAWLHEGGWEEVRLLDWVLVGHTVCYLRGVGREGDSGGCLWVGRQRRTGEKFYFYADIRLSLFSGEGYVCVWQSRLGFHFLREVVPRRFRRACIEDGSINILCTHTSPTHHSRATFIIPQCSCVCSDGWPRMEYFDKQHNSALRRLRQRGM